jgi:beta-glucanase (GH16 family)
MTVFTEWVWPAWSVSRRRALGLGGLAFVSVLASACSPSPDPKGRTATTPPVPTPTADTDEPEWSVVWEEDFSRATLDPQVWTLSDYGGNRDLNEQHYNDPEMVALEEGNLVLHARRQERDGYPYVAGSISSKDKLTVGPYGRLTTRQLLGPGHGLGFGVCLYGADIDAVGWPGCGEIDATEIALARPTSPFASIHGPGYSGGSPISAAGDIPSVVNRWAEHVLQWEPGRITWAIDGQVYHVAEASDPRAVAGWPFDQPFFITIVLTVGSYLSGPVDATTWPRDEEGKELDPYAVVDFVRFEQRAG